MNPPLTYTMSPLDRAVMIRGDLARVQALLTGGNARIMPMWNQQHLVDEEPRLRFLTYEEAATASILSDAALVFLGLADETPWFALGLPNTDAPPDFAIRGTFKTPADVVALLPGEEASLMAYARAMILWHQNHRHCGRCGAQTDMTEAGHSRTCTSPACGNRTFPRTDPVVITLITHRDKSGEEKCLLGRQAKFPPGMYSCVAGFVEAGETLEAAVRREAAEETGVVVGDVRYVASQPWPFPASLMLGFRADALTTEIHRDDEELEDCRWFSKADLRNAGERDSNGPGLKLPNRFAIARFLIEGWLAT